MRAPFCLSVRSHNTTQLFTARPPHRSLSTQFGLVTSRSGDDWRHTSTCQIAVADAHIEHSPAHRRPYLVRRQRHRRTARDLRQLHGADLRVHPGPGTHPNFHRGGVRVPACVRRDQRELTRQPGRNGRSLSVSQSFRGSAVLKRFLVSLPPNSCFFAPHPQVHIVTERGEMRCVFCLRDIACQR